MQNIFISIFEMSVIASYVAIAVIITRLLLKKAPKIFAYTLWVVVLFRLVCPFSITSPISLVGLMNQEPSVFIELIVPEGKEVANIPIVETGSDVDLGKDANQGNEATPNNSLVYNTNPQYTAIGVVTYIWLFGIIILLLYSVISYLILIKKVKTAMLIQNNIYETDRIATPFVCGFIKPKIYLPLGLEGDELSYILKHEQTHIKRFDYLTKPFAFLVLIIHWFNPIMWFSFILMTKDMEMSCDEKVLKMETDIKKKYSNSLLSLSTNKRIPMATPLAFGESNTKARIKNILNYKKPGMWVILIAICVCIGIMIVCITNPSNSSDLDSKTNTSSKDNADNGGNKDEIALDRFKIYFYEGIKTDNYNYEEGNLLCTGNDIEWMDWEEQRIRFKTSFIEERKMYYEPDSKNNIPIDGSKVLGVSFDSTFAIFIDDVFIYAGDFTGPGNISNKSLNSHIIDDIEEDTVMILKYSINAVQYIIDEDMRIYNFFKDNRLIRANTRLPQIVSIEFLNETDEQIQEDAGWYNLSPITKIKINFTGIADYASIYITPTGTEQLENRRLVATIPIEQLEYQQQFIIYTWDLGNESYLDHLQVELVKGNMAVYSDSFNVYYENVD